MTPDVEPSLTILETPRLRLRRTRHTDIPSRIALWTDPEVTRHMGGPREESILTRAFTEAVERPFAEPYDLWPVEEKITREVIGDCGLLQKDIEGANEIELVYVIAQNRWGRGYATEMAEALKLYALKTLGHKRLVALVDPENTSSEQVAKKIGMRLEKEVVRPGGEIRLLFVVEDT